MPLTIAISNSATSSKFPDMAKVAAVIPFDKKTDDKFDISNFGPVYLLDYFWKVYESSIKCRLVDSMYKNISLEETQHIMLCRLLEEWIKNLDKNYIVGRVLMGLCRAF